MDEDTKPRKTTLTCSHLGDAVTVAPSRLPLVVDGKVTSTAGGPRTVSLLVAQARRSWSVAECTSDEARSIAAELVAEADALDAAVKAEPPAVNP